MNSIADTVIQALEKKGIDLKTPGVRYRIKIINIRDYKTDRLLCDVTREDSDLYDKYIFVKEFRLNFSPIKVNSKQTTAADWKSLPSWEIQKKG